MLVGLLLPGTTFTIVLVKAEQPGTLSMRSIFESFGVSIVFNKQTNKHLGLLYQSNEIFLETKFGPNLGNNCR